MIVPAMRARRSYEMEDSGNQGGGKPPQSKEVLGFRLLWSAAVFHRFWCLLFQKDDTAGVLDRRSAPLDPVICGRGE